MFPLNDDNSDNKIIPWINYLLIAMNIFVFVYFQTLGQNESFTNAFSVTPKEIITGQDFTGPTKLYNELTGELVGTIQMVSTPISVYITLLTSMFLHGGVAHIAGNMLYLWIFGDNLENIMGHWKYFTYYLLCGIIAGLSHVLCSLTGHQNLLIPSLGASGAISGVLGGYVLLFPNRRVTVVIMRHITEVPAFVVLGSWIFFQLIESSGILGPSSNSGGVAYAAHIGGFITGVLLVKLFAKSRVNSFRQTNNWK